MVTVPLWLFVPLCALALIGGSLVLFYLYALLVLRD